MSDWPSHQAATGTVEKGKRLAQMIAMGVGYFKAKQALEEHDWNVEEAIASVATTEGTAATTETSPRPNEHPNIASLKGDTSHSRQHFDAAAASKSGESQSQHQHLESLSSKAAASARQQDAHTPDNALDEEAPELGTKNMEAYIQKRENDTFWNEQELLAPSGTASTPSAYYYIRDEDQEQSKTWTESNTTERASRVPELVNASSSEDPSVISGVTYPVEIATHFPETETPVVQDLEDKSAVKKSYGQQPHRLTNRAWMVIALTILVIAFLALAVSLGVTQSRSSESEATQPFTTPAPSISSTIPATSQDSPTTTTLQPIKTSTDPPTVPSVTTLPPTTSTLRPTEPPTELPTEPPISTMEPTIPPPPDGMIVEGAEMVLSGVSSRLDEEARDVWFDVTIAFLKEHLEEVLPRPYEYNVRVRLTSQTEDDDELNIIFTVEFDIESALETHNVQDYVRKALGGGNKDAYIQALQDSYSSFRDVYDVKVSI